MSLEDFENNISSHRYFHSLCLYPSTKFANQQQKERILVVLRAHPITLIPVVTFALFACVLPIFVNIFLADFFNFFEILFINILVYSALFSYVYLNFVLWVHNVGIITNFRIIDISYESILQKSITGTALDDVADITGKTGGFVRSIFNFGNVFVQTAGIEQDIIFKDAPDPDTVVSLVSKIIRENKKIKVVEDHSEDNE